MSPAEPYATAYLNRLEAELAAEPARPPQWVGRYEIVELLGEGGMGAVYKAEQHAPIERTVALKLIKLGMDSREVVRRFESERQALAYMDHPNVAKVLDAGTDPVTGRPFFVMEYVNGQAITRYCDENRLNISQRLGLFAQVCDAVAHAHQKMIIHRDLKSSNILVTSNNGPAWAQVKVIDFGVAKAMISSSADGTLFAEAGQLIGTPEYMSPEQASSEGGQNIDTRTDIYSLGVVLYELLTGALPFDAKTLRSSGAAGIERTLREIDPPRPSTRLSSLGECGGEIAARRRTHFRELARQLKSELEWIPLKAMRKEPAQRYATASEFARDIENYLEHKPLLAGPESGVYRLRKFLRRRRAAVAGGSLVAASLLAGVVGTATFAVRASHQRALAERSAAETRKVADFQSEMLAGINVPLMGTRLREDLLDQAAQGWRQLRLPEHETARRRAALEAQLTAINFTTAALRSLDRNIFEGTLDSIDKQFAGQPLVKARLLQHVARTLITLGLWDRAAAPQLAALEIRRRELGEDDPETLASMSMMGRLLVVLGNSTDAEPYIRRALDGRRRALGNDHPDTISSSWQMGYVLQRLPGRLAGAEPFYREALQGRRRLLGDDHNDTLKALWGLSQVLLWQGKLEEAAPLVEELDERARRVLGYDDSETFCAIQLMARLREDQGRLAEAEAYSRETLQGFRRLKGDDYRDALYASMHLGSLLRKQGKLDEAETHLRSAVQGLRRTKGEDDDDTRQAVTELGRLRQAQELETLNARRDP